MFCEHKNLFGEVNTGPHSYRLLNLAVVDVLSTVILAYFIYKVNGSKKKSFSKILFYTFLFGIFIHRLFCVRTTIDKLLFPDEFLRLF